MEHLLSTDRVNLARRTARHVALTIVDQVRCLSGHHQRSSTFTPGLIPKTPLRVELRRPEVIVGVDTLTLVHTPGVGALRLRRLDGVQNAVTATARDSTEITVRVFSVRHPGDTHTGSVQLRAGDVAATAGGGVRPVETAGAERLNILCQGSARQGIRALSAERRRRQR